VAAGDEARRRIGRDLHDGAQQRLVHTIMTLKLAQKALDPREPVAELVAEALENAMRGLEEARALAHGLHPTILSSRGLVPALEELARRSAIPVKLDLRTGARPPERVELTAYYVVSEALTNAAKHAHASTVTVSVDMTQREFRLSISDDGVGGADVARGSGLIGLRDRVDASGGTLTVQSPSGQGTRLDVELPVTDEMPASSS
jgi:signal transduction histidine kinase